MPRMAQQAKRLGYTKSLGMAQKLLQSPSGRYGGLKPLAALCLSTFTYRRKSRMRYIHLPLRLELHSKYVLSMETWEHCSRGHLWHDKAKSLSLRKRNFISLAAAIELKKHHSKAIS